MAERTAQRAAPDASRPLSRARVKRISRKIDAVLARDINVQRAHIGVRIERLSDGALLYAHDDQQLYVPASNTKILTTTAAFALLGPDWKTRTTVESATAPDASGTISGDLVLVGRGDPNLSGRVLPYNGKTSRTTPPLAPLQALADQIVERGVKHIRGSVVGDDSWFAYERWGDSWGWDDLMWEYGAPVSALTINDNQMFLDIMPGAKVGDIAPFTIDPMSPLYKIEDRVVTGPAGSVRRIGIDREPGSYSIAMWGTIPLNGPADDEGLSIEDPALFAADAFATMLKARGVQIDGAPGTQHADPSTLPFPPLSLPPSQVTSAVPAVATPLQQVAPVEPARVVLAELDSHPLAEDIKVTNKVSQNLHVEILMRQLGRAKSLLPNTPAGGSVWGGTSVVHQFLKSIGVTDDEVQYLDGSGMTPHNLVTPAAFCKVLRYARTQPWGAQFVDSLPLAGVDGTLDNRFVHTPTAGRVRAKTGSLTEVYTLSGYATPLAASKRDSSSSDELVFSVMINDSKMGGKASRAVIDDIVRAIVETK